MPRYADTLLANARSWPCGPASTGPPVRDILYPIIIGSSCSRSSSSSRGSAATASRLGQVRLSWLSIGGLVIAIAWSGWVIWRWASQDYLVTNRRVIKVEGVVDKHSATARSRRSTTPSSTRASSGGCSTSASSTSSPRTRIGRPLQAPEPCPAVQAGDARAEEQPRDGHRPRRRRVADGQPPGHRCRSGAAPAAVASQTRR